MGRRVSTNQAAETSAAGQGEQHEARPRRRVGAARRVLGVALLLIVAVVGVAPLAVQTKWGTRLVASGLSTATGYPVRIASLEVGYWRAPIRATEIQVGEFFRAGAVELAPDLNELRQLRLAGRIVVSGLEVHPERYEPPPPRPEAEEIPARWQLGELTVLLTSRLPALRASFHHREGTITVNADVFELASMHVPAIDRLANLRLRGSLTIPKRLGDLAAWSGDLCVGPIDGGESVFVGLGSVVRDPSFSFSLVGGALRLEEAAAVVDGRPLTVEHAEFVGDRLRIAAEVDGNFEVNADFTGLPGVTAIEEWRELREGGDPRALLGRLVGIASMRMGEYVLEGRTLRDVSLDLQAAEGQLRLERLEGTSDGIDFVATGNLDVNTEPPTATLRLATHSTLVVESLTGISAEAVQLALRLRGVPPWTPQEQIETSGRLELGHVAVDDFAMVDVGIEFAGTGTAFELSRIETVVSGGVRAQGRGELDLAQLPESFVCDMTLLSVDLPGLGPSTMDARITVQGESHLAFDPLRIVSPVDGGGEQVITGSAAFDPMGDSHIPFRLRAERLFLPHSVPEMRDVVVSGFLNDIGESRGRAKLRVGSWDLAESGLAEIVAAVAFDGTGIRFDQATARLDGQTVSAQGDLTFGADEHWTAEATIRLPAYTREGVKLEDVTIHGRIDGVGSRRESLEAGALELSAGRGTVGEHAIERLTVGAEIGPERLVVHEGEVWLDGKRVEFSGEVDLTREGFPADLVVRADQAQIEGASLAGLRAQMHLPRLELPGGWDTLRANGGFELASFIAGDAQLTAIRGRFVLDSGILTSREAEFQIGERAATADLELDLRTAPIGVQTTLRLPSLPFGGYDLRDLEVVARPTADAVDVRSLSATWGEFTLRGGGRLVLPVGEAGSRETWIECTLAMEHPQLRGITLTAQLQRLAVDAAPQPHLTGNLAVSVREVSVLGDVLHDFRVVALAEEGVFSTQELSVRWGTGDLSGRGRFDASGEVAAYELSLTASKIPIHSSMGRPLGFVLPIFSGAETVVKGSLDGQLRVRGQGLTRADLDRHLTGGGSAYVRDGKVSGSPVMGVVSGWHGLSGVTNVTADTAFRIADGKVSTTRDLVVRSNQDLLTMKGSVDFDRRLTYEGKVKAIGGQLSPEIAPFTTILARDGFLPFRLTGTVENPNFELAPLDKLLERSIESLLDPRTWLELFGEDR